jgi:hypothetical protein
MRTACEDFCEASATFCDDGAVGCDEFCQMIEDTLGPCPDAVDFIECMTEFSREREACVHGRNGSSCGFFGSLLDQCAAP